MQADIMKEITDYIDFLRSCGFSVTVSCSYDAFGAQLLPLLDYEIHLPAICSYLKTDPKTIGKCLHHKHDRFFKTEFPELCYRCCYAGVEEYIYPIHYDGKQLMCINISGFRGKLPQAKRLAEKLSARCGPKFEALYQELSKEVPPPEKIEALAAPLKYMVIALYQQCRETTDTPARQLCRQVLQYICDNYMYRIRCRDIADALGYSESHMRFIYQNETGITPARQLTLTRLNRAAYLLTATSMSVTEIALACGFDSANYFSTVFRGQYQMSPRDYRNQNG